VLHQLTLKRNEEHRIAGGHLWVFSNEIQSIDGQPQSGDVVRILDSRGKDLGIAFYNPHSLIAARLLATSEEEIGTGFFSTRIASALALRRTLFPGSETFRLVHGESDFLPGLVIDKYEDACVLQTFSAGMERRLPEICDALSSLLHPRGIVERNESPLRSLEGLELRKGILRGSVETVSFIEEGIKYAVDLLEGQKTGFFLDQRENRRAIRRYARGSAVLDCFSNDGGFSLNSAAGGAVSVLGVDASESAVMRASANAATNGLDAEFVCRDAFEFLRHLTAGEQRFGLIILDPPSFAKSKKSLAKAKRGYKELHTLALKLLSPGGILATASCSHHIFEETFLEIVQSSAQSAHRQVKLLEWRGAAPDHPVLPGMPETRYLKMGIFQIT